MLLALLIALGAPGRLEAAPKIGLFEPTSRLSGAMFAGAELGYASPALGERLWIVMEVDWVRPHASGTITDARILSPGQSYSLQHSEVGVLLSAVLRLPDLSRRLTPYGGLGPGLYFHRAATAAFGSSYLETEAHLGLQVLAGADFTIGPGAGFGEARYHFARVDFISTGNADAGGFAALCLGYRLRF